MELNSLNKDRNRRKASNDGSTIIYGKVPPQAVKVEEAVLGAIMIEKSAFDIVAEILKTECFYKEEHKLIYQAMVCVNKKGQIIEILTVIDELIKMESLDLVGGPYYVTKLTNDVVSTAALDQHARIVLEKFILREHIRISSEIINMAYDDTSDPFDVTDFAETQVFGISNSFLKKDYEKITTIATKVVTRIDQLRSSNEMLSGIPSGFNSLDRVTYGWQPTDLIILAARPSVGKTAFALNLAINAAKSYYKKTPVGFFSLEMSSPQLVQRILSAESEVHMEKISRGKMDDTDYVTLLSRGISKIDSMDIYIDDSAALNIFEFRAKARRMVNKHKVGIIIIDYLQLMGGMKDRNGNREQEISNISRNLKALAKELSVPIIALSQLSRAVETRKESKIPQLSDLRESGAIEQDADMVMFIYRPEYYGNTHNEMGESTYGLTEIKIAKHRNGALETIKLRADLRIQKFYEYDDPAASNFIPIASLTQPGLPYKQPENDFDSGFTENQSF